MFLSDQTVRAHVRICEQTKSGHEAKDSFGFLCPCGQNVERVRNESYAHTNTDSG